MDDDIKEYCKTCNKCQTIKPVSKLRAQLQPILAKSPWDIIGIDIAGPLTLSKFGNKYIIVAIDYYTKFCIAQAISDFTALTTARFIFNEIICKFGRANRIHTDRGVNFESNLLKELLLLLKIDKPSSTSYHPICCGEVERQNRTIKQILACYVNEKHDDWDVYLPQAVRAYNTAKHDSFGNKISPFEALFHRQDDTSIDCSKLGSNQQSLTNVIAKNQLIITEGLLNSKIVQQQQYNKKLNEDFKFKIGDLVLIDSKQMKTGQTKKFVPKYHGPFQITRINGTTYDLIEVNSNSSNNNKKKKTQVHYNRLKPYHSRVVEDGSQITSTGKTSELTAVITPEPVPTLAPAVRRSGRVLKR